MDWIGKRKCAPIPERTTFGAKASVVSGGRNTACTPAAAAVRSNVPRLPGSRIWSGMRMKFGESGIGSGRVEERRGSLVESLCHSGISSEVRKLLPLQSHVIISAPRASFHAALRSHRKVQIEISSLWLLLPRPASRPRPRTRLLHVVPLRVPAMRAPV